MPTILPLRAPLRAALTAAALATATPLAVPAAAGAADDPLRPHQWGLFAVRADAAHTVTRGEGVTVAVIDSGADLAHPDLAARLVPGPDLVDGDSVPADLNGHGTHVAGIVAAVAGNGVGVEGAAPGTRVLVIRALDAANSGSTTTIAQAIDAAVARGARVINLSLSAGPDAPDRILADSAFVQAIERAVAAGAVVVAAAGNFSLPICSQPLVTGRILCVGAVDEQRQRASFSNYGFRVDMVAPGEKIMSTTINGRYGSMSGTSQATPHVAAAAALLLAQGHDAQTAIGRLLATAQDLGVPGPDAVFGAGMLDMAAALGGPVATSRTATASRRPAKLRVRRARIADGRLDVLAQMTRRATGELSGRLRSGGRTHRFTARVRDDGTVRIDERLPRAMRRATTGIVRLTYDGNARVRPSEVRLRAAQRPARLRRTASSLENGVLRVRGTITRRARGVVRVRYDYVGADGRLVSLRLRAPIRRGRWSVEERLTGAAAQGGFLSIQFTGDLRHRIRGEQTTKAVS